MPYKYKLILSNYYIKYKEFHYKMQAILYKRFHFLQNIQLINPLIHSFTK